MKNEQKILIGAVGFGLLVLFLIFYKHKSPTVIVTPGTTSSQQLPTVAATPAATYEFPPNITMPGGTYQPYQIANPTSQTGCCNSCSIPGGNNTQNFLAATPSSLITLAADNTDYSQWQNELETTAQLTNYAPQTSALTDMILSRIGAIGN